MGRKRGSKRRSTTQKKRAQIKRDFVKELRRRRVKRLRRDPPNTKTVSDRQKSYRAVKPTNLHRVADDKSAVKGASAPKKAVAPPGAKGGPLKKALQVDYQPSRERARCKRRPPDNRSKGGASRSYIPWCNRRK
ncbi:hypothetical protein [Microviridae sp.]|nr:hypothetical protein [Microviridae sp.]